MKANLSPMEYLKEISDDVEWWEENKPADLKIEKKEKKKVGKKEEKIEAKKEENTAEEKKVSAIF